MTRALPEHFFRHESGRLVAGLVRRVGARHLEIVEDAVQGALLSGLETWSRGALPDEPSAWLYRVAERRVLDELRRNARRLRILGERGDDVDRAENEVPRASLPGDVDDDLLRMLFVCCDDTIPVESQAVLALKPLCGFDVREIAERLFTSEANVYKRISRARARLREKPPSSGEFSNDELVLRAPTVRSILYAMFTEGHLSLREDRALRQDVCDEALRLAHLLARHPSTASPESFALVALMHLHSARTPSRQDASGGLLLLEEQDRSLWDMDEIHTGLAWLARSAEGPVFSRYHAEAGIAAEHVLAPSMAGTRWDRIAACYASLEATAPSPLHALNRAVAVAEAEGPRAGLAIVEKLDAPPSLVESWMWNAVLADLHRRAGQVAKARAFGDAAMGKAPSEATRALLGRRLGLPTSTRS